MHTGFSYYEILGLSESASADEIKRAYRAAMLKYHPDVSSAPNAQRLTEMLNDAYSILSDPAQRQAYTFCLPPFRWLRLQKGMILTPRSSRRPSLKRSTRAVILSAV